MGNNPPMMQEIIDVGAISGPERCPGEGNGNPLQYPMTEEPVRLQSIGSQKSQT